MNNIFYLNSLSELLYTRISQNFSVYKRVEEENFVILKIKNKEKEKIKIFKNFNFSEIRIILNNIITLEKVRNIADFLPSIKFILYRNNSYIISDPVYEKGDIVVAIIEECLPLNFYCFYSLINYKLMILEIIMIYNILSSVDIYLPSIKKEHIKFRNVRYYRSYSIANKRYLIDSQFMPIITGINKISKDKKKNNFRIVIREILDIFEIEDKEDILDNFSEYLFNKPILNVPIKYISI